MSRIHRSDFIVIIDRDYFLPSVIVDVLSDDEVVVDHLRDVATGDILHNTKGNLLVGGIGLIEDLFEDYHILKVIVVSNVPGTIYKPAVGDELKKLGNSMSEK